MDIAENNEERTDLICKLPGSMKRRRYLEIHKLLDSVQIVSELDNGYAFSYQSSEKIINQIVEYIKLERECCPFLTFELRFEKNNGPILLIINGASGAKTIIKNMTGI